MEAGCVTGDRINGLADGVTGEWFTTYDFLTPAVEKGLPFTQVISRITLQDILVKAVGLDIVHNKSKVVDFVEDPDKVTIVLEEGRKFEGDVLVGADGIWSEVRSKLFGLKEAQYSEYTCYSGLIDYVPPYINTIGYRVFLGFNQYFAATDIGGGKMQWYGFHKEPPGNTDPPGGKLLLFMYNETVVFVIHVIGIQCKKERLLELFGRWCSEVVTLISETPEHMIIRRDLYDRHMLYTWSRGRVTLLGDAAHAMQTNLGQGGDCYRLLLELEEAVKRSPDDPTYEDIAASLKRMATSYRPDLNFGSGRLSFLTVLRITHLAICSARMFIHLGMSQLLTWMLLNHGVTISCSILMPPLCLTLINLSCKLLVGCGRKRSLGLA
ncbi:hypothetical protein MKX01_037847 [Papaver californicum]|nr:hypothetical protein MKX01_037847 [Papaver californicum]